MRMTRRSDTIADDPARAAMFSPKPTAITAASA
jgi:hypothetical protein